MTQDNTLGEYQKIIDTWILDHGGYWSPLSMLSAIVEEVGELAKEVNRLEGYKPKKPDEPKIDIGEELADVVFSVICVANYYKINMNRELSLVIEKFTKRDSNRFT
ncbi:MAG: nucleotide pyrophosphohydrolase [Candidatus Hermodarchaeota archaeon]